MYDFAHPSGRTTRLTNTNKLIRAYEGCDGGKTGFTNEAMSCLSATAQRAGTRLISIVIGGADSKSRNAEVCKLFNYGFANYETKQVISKGEALPDCVPVKNGKTDNVGAVYADSLGLFIKKGDEKNCEIATEIQPQSAPLAEGSIIGKASIVVDGNTVGCVDILAAGNVEKKGYIDIVDEFIDKW